jgi:hypothetical protein
MSSHIGTDVGWHVKCLVDFEMSALATGIGVRVPKEGWHAIHGKRRRGAGDESTGSDFVDDGQTNQLV